MKTLIFFVALFLSSWAMLFFAATPARAQSSLPPCWPKQLGSTGSDYKRGSTDDGQWLAWTCTVRGQRKVFGAVSVAGYEVKHPDVTGLTPTKAARAYYLANVVATDPDPRLVRLRAAAQAAFAE